MIAVAEAYCPSCGGDDLDCICERPTPSFQTREEELEAMLLYVMHSWKEMKESNDALRLVLKLGEKQREQYQNRLREIRDLEARLKLEKDSNRDLEAQIRTLHVLLRER